MRAYLDTPRIVWLTVAFAGGVALAGRWAAPPLLAAGCAAATLAVWAGARALGAGRLRVLSGITLLGVLGLLHATLHAGRLPAWPQAIDGRVVAVSGTIAAPPEATARGWRAVVRLSAIGPLDGPLGSPGTQARPTRRARLPPEAEPVEWVRVSDSVRITGQGDPPTTGVGAQVAARGRFRAGRPPGNPGERSERDALRRRGLAGVVALRPGSDLVVVRSGGPSVRGAIAAVRRKVIDAALRTLPHPQGGLLLSLLLGIDSHLDPAVYQQFSRAGLVHLMVVSGAQVAIVAGVCAWIGRTARLPLTIATVATGIGVGVFAAIVDWAPSIGRAVLMATVGLGAVLLGRQRDRSATLATAALALLVLNPEALFDIGFQLSFAATWGLLYLAPVLEQALSVLGPRLGAALGVTLGAQLAVAPLLALHFQTAAVAGLIANVLVLPLIAVLVPVGFAMIPVVVLSPPLGAPLLHLLRPGLVAALWLAEQFGDLSWATVPTPPLSWPVATALLGFLGLGAAAGAGRLPLSRSQRLAAWGIAAAVLVLWWTQATRPPAFLVVTALDVGQGDAILIQSPGGRTMLVDGGGEIGAGRGGWDVGRMRVVPALRRAGVRRLDAVMLTHPHEDHVGGLPAVLENFPVGLVLDPGVPHPSPSYTRLLHLVEAGRIPYRTARAGMRVDLGGGVALTILYPPDPIPVFRGDRVHAGSVVGRLAYGQTVALLTGDAEAPAERLLVDGGVELTAQVLKVGHHGSRTSTTPAFVTRVQPQYAVISVGADNSFGHPHQVTLDTLAAAGVTVYRTDRDGAVRFTSNGSTWRVATARAGSRAGVR